MASWSISVRNLRERERLGFPLALLEGSVDRSPRSVENLPAGCFLRARVVLEPAAARRWPVARASGAFKAFVLLPLPGKFVIELEIPELGCQTSFHVEFAPVSAPEFVVRFYYQKSSDATGGFDAPPGVDNSDAAAVAKIQTAALLMQTATAEMMHDAGFGRRSFTMELQPEDGKPVVHVLRTSFSNATAREIHDQKLIRLVEDDIRAQGFDKDERRKFKHAVILGCSTYNPATHKAEGHTALGGGKVGVFGSCGLHSWPSSIADITACCLNNARIDTNRLLDDSCYRCTFWANFSTGIGAFLHELGHTFGLGHSVSGIMARGFDDMNKLFSVYEISSRSSAKGFEGHFTDGFLELNYGAITEVNLKAGAHWNLGSAALLKNFPWISGQPVRSTVGPTISWEDYTRGPVGNGDYDGEQISFSTPVISSPARIGAVMIDAGKYVNKIQVFTREKVAELANSGECRSSGNTHWLVLAEHEYIQRVDVRAMAWIDGLQIHTNLQSSRWYGGFGGKLHALSAAPGYAITSLFGSRGNNYVGKLGVRCHPYTTTPQEHLLLNLTVSSTTMRPISGQFPAAGLALERSQTPFGLDNNTVKSGSTLSIRCNSYVEAFRVEAPSANRYRSEENQRPSDMHIFQLCKGEYFTALEVKSGHWVDALRFHTNFRRSPWYGGKGGDHHVVMECPPGNQISAFFGSHGERYLGSIGAMYSALDFTSADLEHAQDHPGAPNQIASFSLMRNVQSTTTNGARQPLPRGIVIAMRGGNVTLVQSFRAIEELFLEEAGLPEGELYFLMLKGQEAVLQIDASIHTGPDRTVIDGVCIHTTRRCSEWIGAFHSDKQVMFFVAPHGHAVLRFRSVHDDATSSFVDVVGFTAPICLSDDADVDRINSEYAENLRLASWSHDVRVESASGHPIESVVLSRRGGEDLDCHAWQWSAFFDSKTSQTALHRWCIPFRMLESYLPEKIQNMSPESRNSAVKSKLIVGAVDVGGGWNKAAMADA